MVRTVSGIAAGYLIWFGIGLIRTTTISGQREMVVSKGWMAASFFNSGLALTLCCFGQS